MKFIPNSNKHEEILTEMGLKNISELFKDIPEQIIIDKLEMPQGLDQLQTEQDLRAIADKNKSVNEFLCFLGGGIKPHYIPAMVKQMSSRPEFYTAYTPYQSEASQGFLQAMFEYQSMISELTKMDAANCSLYDGVTALAEASLMCSRITKKTEILIPKNISEDKKQVLKNYIKGPGLTIKQIDFDEKTGKIDIDHLKKVITDKTAGVYIENPNYFGVLEEDIDKISKIIKEKNTLFMVGIDPLSLGIIKPPGEYGADIVIGEGRVFGNEMDFGGSSLGIFACKKEYIRQMPGRIIGLTHDKEGKRAFCMALQTREQHIRRSRATSNICTNEGLCALTAAIYLSWAGGKGIEKIASQNLEKLQTLKREIEKIKGLKIRFNSSNFNELVIETEKPSDRIINELLERNIQIGPALDDTFQELKNCILLGVTEIHTNKDIKKLAENLKEVM